MYIRTPHAAVYVDPAEALFKTKPPPPLSQRPASLLARSPTQSSHYRPRILWADRPLLAPAGRFLGVRLLSGVIEVALVRVGSHEVRWIKPEGLLSQRQVDRWVGTTRFR